eukprot:g10466.t1
MGTRPPPRFCALAFSHCRVEAGTANAPIAQRAESPRRPLPVGHPSLMSPHTSPIALNGNRVFVVNTPSDTVDVIDRRTQKLVARVHVGVDPVSLAVRPDGKELWVSNHVSDSVSVIDIDRKSPTDLRVIATIQEFDLRTRTTRFDEPMGIAFANNRKAYVALSSQNTIAVIDVKSRAVTKRLRIPAQDPRAIFVRHGRLYVVPFESNNKTQLSGGSKIDGKLVTFNAWEHSIRVNNVLSLGHVVDIVKHPEVPDRDLFVFDTQTDKLIETVDSLGTLLYGLTVDSSGRVLIAQTDARNHINGRSGTQKHGMKEMQNRAFLNQITTVSFKDGKAEKPRFINLEPLPPKHPEPGQALATPFAIQISRDDSTLFVSAAGSDKLFTVDAKSGKVLGRVSVGAVPRGIALDHSGDGKPSRAWVYNAVANTVSIVDVSNPAMPKTAGVVPLEDPTDRQLKQGRIAFNDAGASTTRTFSCASCHPDGHTDQLLWVLKTPVVTGGNQIMPRSTMPIRGLRDTAPFHWDGVPGDPYGGINSASIRKHVPPNSRLDTPESSARHLIDGGLATTMHLEGNTAVNDEGKVGRLSAEQRDAMAKFLLNVPYPPARKRAYDNVVSQRAKQGFRLFHIDGDLDPSKNRPNVCGNCHRMPFWVSTNTPGTGMDAPTWRGANDRFLILPQGRLNIIDFPFYRRVAEQGQAERSIWQFSWGGRRRFDPVWDMVLEGSTGFSGAFARQLTLSRNTHADKLTLDLLTALESAAREDAVVLEAEGALLDGKTAKPIALQFDATDNRGAYVEKVGARTRYSRKQLIALAKAGKFVGTFTGRHGANVACKSPQPAIWTLGPIEKQRGRQKFPILFDGNPRMTISGRHLDPAARVVVDGRRVSGRVILKEKETVVVEFKKLPAEGMHLLQLQNPAGLFSNDFIFHVARDEKAAAALQRRIDDSQVDFASALANAIAKGNLNDVKKLLARKSGLISSRQRRSGSTPLSHAALHGRLEIAKFLIARGAKVQATNRDGNTPLHVAAFLCRSDIVKLLLDNGASPVVKNGRGETAIDVVSGEWNDQLGALYTGIGNAVGVKVDLKRIQRKRPEIAKQLRLSTEKSKQNRKKQ